MLIIACGISPRLTPPLSYGRIETLSGFANGIFLILISIFIIFEAIERLSALSSLAIVLG
jgi:Co/Zn/Cd efflux system component